MKGIVTCALGKSSACFVLLFLMGGCQLGTSGLQQQAVVEQPQFSIPKTATHTKFSRELEPVARVPSGVSLKYLPTKRAEGNSSSVQA